jgi:non-canonical (house-cleaning) NTP pyrophosphatase
MRIVVTGSGSPSSHKLNAIRAALRQLGTPVDRFLQFDVGSGVNKQPEGIIEIRRGASNRATRAWTEAWFKMGEEWRDGGLTPGDIELISVGLENGAEPLLDLPSDHEDQQHAETGACVIKSSLETEITTTVPGHMLHPADVAEARRRGFDKCIVSTITRERTGCDDTDTTPYHTNGKVTRVDCLEIAVRIALAQYFAIKERLRGTGA